MRRTPHIGISGWTYAPWRKSFYPAGLVQRHELEFAARQVNSIEINGAFYSLAKPASFAKWAAAVPDDFVFSVKAHRFITHIKKLHDVAEPVSNFFASGLLALGPKLGPVLWQFPPAMKFDAERFETFLKLLPHDAKAAARLARRHGAMMKGRTFIPPPRTRNFRIRHAVEVRHPSFQNPEFVKLCRDHGVAVVFADSGGKYPLFTLPTADFVYARLHGPAEMYVDGYDAPTLAAWAKKLKGWLKTRDVFVYFDNDVKVQAPYNAVDLLRRTIPGYAPEVPMDPANVAGLHTPGPRLTDDDPRWRRRKKKTRAA